MPQNSDPTPEPDNALPPQPRAQRLRRASRYDRVQQRKAQQKASDSRFYAGMFILMGVLALLAILMGAIMLNGVPTQGGDLSDWTTPWLLGFTKLEVFGVGFVGVIAGIVLWRMYRQR